MAISNSLFEMTVALHVVMYAFSNGFTYLISVSITF